jgi:REP element-mobilizing transposase RayT
MSHTYASNRVHIVFSTKNRKELISEPNQALLWAFLAGIGNKVGAQVFKVGGTSNHLHALIALPATLSLAAAVQRIKSSSSQWMGENGVKGFEWQQGYAAFSVSASGVDAVVKYIDGQAEHHAKYSFEDEFRSLLIRHGVPFNERYVFG